MTTVVFKDNSYQAQQLLNFISTLPFVEVVGEQKKSFAEAAAECNAISSKEFFNEVRRQVNEHYDNDA